MSATQPILPGPSVAGWRSVGEELQSALDLQRSLLPPGFHRGPRFEVAAAVRSANGMSGEFFDYEETDATLRLSVGNVCGTGAPAALQAAVVQGMLAVQAKGEGGPAQVVERLNRTLCRRPFPDSFVTLFYGRVTQDRRLIHCSAGLCRPLLVTGDSVHQLGTGGPPAGVEPDARYAENSVALGEGDMLLVFSLCLDAAAADRSPRCLAPDRLLKIVHRYRDLSATLLLDRLLREAWPHIPGDTSQDDVTAVVVRCLG